jgi:hypothetical protein
MNSLKVTCLSTPPAARGRRYPYRGAVSFPRELTGHLCLVTVPNYYLLPLYQYWAIDGWGRFAQLGFFLHPMSAFLGLSPSSAGIFCFLYVLLASLLSSQAILRSLTPPLTKSLARSFELLDSITVLHTT